jgi:fucose 4-O-acetylase-like acetyltransferase
MQMARGIGILLVTFGHSIPLKEDYPAIYNFIYSFHMPLFFFLSGFFATKLLNISTINDWIKILSRSTLKLIIPYFVISLSYGLIKYFIPHMVKRLFLWQDFFYVITVYPLSNPALFLWFLYLIIIMRIVTPIISKINPWLFFLFLLIFQFFPIDYDLFAIGWFLNYFIYYFIGTQISQLKDSFFVLMRNRWLMGLYLAVFVIAYVSSSYVEYQFVKFLTAVSGSFSAISLCFAYSNFLPKKALDLLGFYSLQIYLLQFFFIFPLAHIFQTLGISNIPTIIATFSLGVICPLVISIYILPRNRVLSLLFGGIDRFSSIKKQ